MTDNSRSGLRRRLLAWLLARGNARYERLVAERKRALFAELTGDVLEIGPGAGANLPYVPRGIRWIGLEPNVHMHAYLRKEAERLGLAVELRTGTAERTGLADASVDAVVATLVLCSVADQAAVLQETLRVLRPGGRFIFVEHVAAPRGTWRRRVQRWARPVTEFCGDGCHPDRETWTAIERAGFEEVQLERFELPIGLMAPHVAGVAVKRSA